MPWRDDINRSHGTSFTGANVAIQPGGKPVIQKFFLSLMNPGDEVLIPAPGYPIYESMVAFHGGKPVPYPYRENSSGFALDLVELEKRITPATRFLVFNNLQNPTGAEEDEKGLAAVADLVLRRNLTVLCDEAYFDMRYTGTSRSLVSYPGMVERCLILYTFSKKYAMTGWRLGAAVGPKDLVDSIAKLNVNDESCSNHFVQYGGLEALKGSQDGSRAIIRTLQQRRDRCHELVNKVPGIRCHRPNATFYLFPNVTEAMRTDEDRRLRGVPQGGPGKDGRLLLHPAALRHPDPRGARALHPAVLLRHRDRRDRGRHGTAAGLRRRPSPRK